MKTEIRDLVLAKEAQGDIVFATIDGLRSIKLDDFIRQPADGILYDLNRSREVVLTFIDDPKWVNDFAVCLVITKLKSEIDRLKKCLKQRN